MNYHYDLDTYMRIRALKRIAGQIKTLASPEDIPACIPASYHEFYLKLPPDQKKSLCDAFRK